MQLPHIASRIFNTPLLIHDEKIDAIIFGLRDRLGVTAPAPAPGLFTTQQGEVKEPGFRVIGKVGVIDIFGVLAHRGGMAADSSWVLGYQEIARRLDSAVNDRDVEAIVLNFDTPGGEASPVPDLAARIRDTGQNIKPVHGVAGCHMHSAGMWLGAACNSISITRMGYAGSVGVVTRHVDYSKYLENEGIVVTHIYAGKHKVDGHQFAPLPESVRDDLQNEIDSIYNMFVSAVAEYRGLDEQQVRDTEARSFMGLEAVAAGLADRIETPDHLIARLNSEISTGTTKPRAYSETTMEANTMSKEQKPDNPAQAADQSEEATALGVAAAETESATTTEEASEAEVETEAAVDATAIRTEERQRFAKVMNSDAAAGREKAALRLATETDMSAETIINTLNDLPAHQATGGRLDQLMAQTEQPNIGAETEGGEQSKSASILSNYNAATGRK